MSLDYKNICKVGNLCNWTFTNLIEPALKSFPKRNERIKSPPKQRSELKLQQIYAQNCTLSETTTKKKIDKRKDLFLLTGPSITHGSHFHAPGLYHS